MSMRLKKLMALFKTKGLSGLVRTVFVFLNYHLRDKWRFTYFELGLSEKPFSLPDPGDSMTIRLLMPEDIDRFKADVYPFMTDKQEYDKRFIKDLSDGNCFFFIAEQSGRIVHYFVGFKNALNSPLMDTPFKKHLVRPDDAYLGNAFTVPYARGHWIVPHVILKIFDYLKNESTANRALLLIHEDTPGAAGFFKRLGFNEIANNY